MSTVKRQAKKGQGLTPAITELVTALGAMPVNAANIATADPATRKRAYASLNGLVGARFPDLVADFKKRKSDLQSREHMAAFILDTQNGLKKAINSYGRSTINDDEETIEWIHESELAWPRFPNSADGAMAAIWLTGLRNIRAYVQRVGSNSRGTRP